MRQEPVPGFHSPYLFSFLSSVVYNGGIPFIPLRHRSLPCEPSLSSRASCFFSAS